MYEFSTFLATFTEQRADPIVQPMPIEGAADTLAVAPFSWIVDDGAVEQAAPAVGAANAGAVQLLPAGTLTIWLGWP